LGGPRQFPDQAPSPTTWTPGDTTTLANPDIVAQIRELVQGRNVAPLMEGPEDVKRFGDER
jgi:hypothetical protein